MPLLIKGRNDTTFTLVQGELYWTLHEPKHPTQIVEPWVGRYYCRYDTEHVLRDDVAGAACKELLLPETGMLVFQTKGDALLTYPAAKLTEIEHDLRGGVLL